MKTFGEFITRNVWLASLLALMCAILPLLGWLAMVVVALISLRKGAAQGLLVLLWACLPSIVMLAMGWHGSTLQVCYFVINGLVVWFMALLLRASSWATTLQITAGIGVLAVLALHGVYPEWVTQMQAYLQQLFANANMVTPSQQQVIALWSKNVVHLFVVSTIAFSALWLVLARWWQSVLFNPGELKTELHNIRLNKYFALIAIILMALLIFVHSQWLMDLVPVILLPFSIAGLSIIHSMFSAYKIHIAWLVGFYILLVILMGFVSSFLAVAAIVDSWTNVRSRWQKRG
jgi:hypothetical protein